MLCDAPAAPVEHIHSNIAGHPERAVLLFEGGAQKIGRQAGGVIRFVPEAREFSRLGIETAEAAARSKPDYSVAILPDVIHWRFEFSRTSVYVRERFRGRVVAVQMLIRSHPKHP